MPLWSHAISRAAGITSPSADLLDRVRREYRLPLEHAEVIPNPAPSIPDDQQWNVRTADRDLILFVGRFDTHKGGDLVIEAFAKIAASRPSIRLAFIGPDRGLRDGNGNSVDFTAFLADRVSDLSICNRIQRLGEMRSTEIRKWRLRSALTIVASRYETFGMTVLEALAHGCPLVAARVGGIQEMINDRNNGLLFEPGNVDDLAQCLELMLDSPESAAQWGAQGAKDARTHYADHVVATKTMAFYERFLARCKGGFPS